MYEKIMKILCELEAIGDVNVWSTKPKMIKFDVNDFEGFNEEWEEIMREPENAEKLDELFKILETKATSVDRDLYSIYHFDNFDVQVGYASYDI